MRTASFLILGAAAICVSCGNRSNPVSHDARQDVSPDGQRDGAKQADTAVARDVSSLSGDAAQPSSADGGRPPGDSRVLDPNNAADAGMAQDLGWQNADVVGSRSDIYEDLRAVAPEIPDSGTAVSPDGRFLQDVPSSQPDVIDATTIPPILDSAQTEADVPIEPVLDAPAQDSPMVFADVAPLADASTADLSAADAPSSACSVLGTSAVQVLDSFDWPIEPPAGIEAGYRYYSRLAADRGLMGDGTPAHGVVISNGAARLTAQQGTTGTSWAGIWYSLSEKAANTQQTLNLSAALPGRVASSLQVSVTSCSIRAKGNGPLKLEVKSANGTLLAAWSFNISSSDFVTLTHDIPSNLGPVKLLNVIADSPADITLDEISFETQVPSLSPLRYAFLVSYGQMLRCMDPLTGLVRDHAQWPIGDFDSVPGMGFAALASATAADLGFVSHDDAAAVATSAIQALLAVPREPTTGWLPHWLKSGQRHPDSEWSTVDTALGLLSAIQAATMLGLDNLRTSLRNLIDTLDFAAVTNSSQQISHGLDAAGNVLSGVWDPWGGETAVVALLRGYQNPCLPDLSFSHAPPAYAGRGFITELAALFVRELGASPLTLDRWGVDWHAERARHLAAQRAYAGNSTIFGLSPAEVISPDGVTAYLEAGIGTQNPSVQALDTLGVQGGPWRMPHYMAMTASLGAEAGCKSALALRTAGLLPPLSGPAESVLVGPGGSVQRWHSVQTALDAFFETLGWYHAVVAAEGRADAVYQAVASDPRYSAALGVIVPPVPVCAPAQIKLEAEAGTGNGELKPRSNASGSQTIWLHSGESRSSSFTLSARASYLVALTYSNDNYGPTETVNVTLDGSSLASFSAEDTGDFGNGWNNFVVYSVATPLTLDPGPHTLTVQVSGGDGNGVEIDVATLTKQASPP